MLLISSQMDIQKIDKTQLNIFKRNYISLNIREKSQKNENIILEIKIIVTYNWLLNLSFYLKYREYQSNLIYLPRNEDLAERRYE